MLDVFRKNIVQLQESYEGMMRDCILEETRGKMRDILYGLWERSGGVNAVAPQDIQSAPSKDSTDWLHGPDGTAELRKEYIPGGGHS